MTIPFIPDTCPSVPSNIKGSSYLDFTIIPATRTSIEPSITKIQIADPFPVDSTALPSSSSILNLHLRYPRIPIRPKDIMGMETDLVDISEGETEETAEKNVDIKGKFVPVFLKMDPTIG